MAESEPNPEYNEHGCTTFEMVSMLLFSLLGLLASALAFVVIRQMSKENKTTAYLYALPKFQAATQMLLSIDGIIATILLFQGFTGVVNPLYYHFVLFGAFLGISTALCLSFLPLGLSWQRHLLVVKEEHPTRRTIIIWEILLTVLGAMGGSVVYVVYGNPETYHLHYGLLGTYDEAVSHHHLSILSVKVLYLVADGLIILHMTVTNCLVMRKVKSMSHALHNTMNTTRQSVISNRMQMNAAIMRQLTAMLIFHLIFTAGPLVYLEAVDDSHLAEVIVFTGAIWAIGSFILHWSGSSDFRASAKRMWWQYPVSSVDTKESASSKGVPNFPQKTPGKLPRFLKGATPGAMS